MRALVLLICLALLLGFVLLRETRTPNDSSDPPDAANERPNILIIMTDDQRASWDGLAVMNKTRRIFGRKGTRFTNAVATTPLCCPSRTSIFSGRYAHNTGVMRQNPAGFDQSTTLQYQLQRDGYTTALTGKYLNNFEERPPHFDYVTQGLRYLNKEGVLAQHYYNKKGLYSTHKIREKALTYLDKFEQADDVPWLMYVHPIAPHLPARPEPKYANAFVPPWDMNPARSESDRRDKPAHVQSIESKVGESVAIRQRQIRTLYSVDDMIADVFARLEALGEDDDTIAFFLSDNGFMWNEHKLSLKNYAYDDAVRIPLYMRWPGHVEQGAVDDRIVANIDIAPTIYDIIDHTPDHTLDGRSLFTSERREILTEAKGHGMPFKALWNPEWMYVENKNGFREYYRPDDPWQLENGFKEGDPPTQAAELAAKLRSASTCEGTTCP